MPFDARLVPLFAASAVSLALALTAWRRRAPGARVFAILLLATTEWAATYAFELVATDLPGKLFWEQLTYLGSATIPVAWLLFTLAYTTRRPVDDRRAGLFLLVVPALVEQALVWTNQLHSLMWTSAGIENLDVSLPLRLDYGPIYWVMLIYDYAVLLAGVWLIARTLVQSGRLYSRQALALLIGVAVPLAGNLAYNADLVGTIDPTPFAFTITGLAFFWGFLRYRFLDLAPVARNVIFEVLRDAVLVLDPLDRIVDVNPASEWVLNRAATDVIGKTLGEIWAELAVLIQGLVDGPCERLEVELVGTEATRYYEVRVSPVRGRGSRVAARVVVLSDITARRAAEELLQASHQFIQEVIANAEEGIVVYDRELRYLMWNPFMERITGFAAAEMIGTQALELLPDLTERSELLARALGGETVQSGDMAYTLSRTGESGWYVATYAPRRDRNGRPDGVIGILHDISERKRAEEVLSHRALHDALTDLPNRTLFHTRAAAAVESAARTETAFALLVVDLDGFKKVNDTLGHGCGDRLLQELARRWRAVLHDGDTLARLGGDEFAVVLPTTSGRRTPGQTAEALQQTLLHSFVFDGHTVRVGASIGLALYPEHGRDIETLLRHADGAMYAAKRSGDSSRAFGAEHAA
jgi:diguanylate cyclase (GGDEF)-like protein/PAS domain S-box-containing protein